MIVVALLVWLWLLAVNSVVIVSCAFMRFNGLWLFWLMRVCLFVGGYVWLVCYCGLVLFGFVLL